MKLSIIIPLYNEQDTIAEVIERLQRLSMPHFISQMEIIVVDDGSSDNSAAIVEKLASKTDQIALLKHFVNRGKGAAIRTGFDKSTGDLIFLQDADVELSPEDLPGMIEVMHKLNVELVNGSRYLDGVIRPLSSFWRYFFNQIFTLLTAVIINVKITDMACGYKLIHRRLFSQLHLTENRFGLEAELVVKAIRLKKNNIAEVPVQYVQRDKMSGKKLNNLDGLRIFWVIIKYGLLGAK